jgi:hypothetical protein
MPKNLKRYYGKHDLHFKESKNRGQTGRFTFLAACRPRRAVAGQRREISGKGYHLQIVRETSRLSPDSSNQRVRPPPKKRIQKSHPLRAAKDGPPAHHRNLLVARMKITSYNHHCSAPFFRALVVYSCQVYSVKGADAVIQSATGELAFAIEVVMLKTIVNGCFATGVCASVAVATIAIANKTLIARSKNSVGPAPSRRRLFIFILDLG